MIILDSFFSEDIDLANLKFKGYALKYKTSPSNYGLFCFDEYEQVELHIKQLNTANKELKQGIIDEDEYNELYISDLYKYCKDEYNDLDYTDFDNKSENGQTVFINSIDDCYYIVVNNDAVTIY